MTEIRENWKTERQESKFKNKIPEVQFYWLGVGSGKCARLGCCCGALKDLSLDSLSCSWQATPSLPMAGYKGAVPHRNGCPKSLRTLGKPFLMFRKVQTAHQETLSKPLQAIKTTTQRQITTKPQNKH